MSRKIRIPQLAVFVGCGVAVLTLGLLEAEEWLSMQEYGLFQNVQAGVLGLLGLWRAEGEARAFWIFVLGFAFFFFWRELDLDQEFFEDRMFSWAYLFRDSVPPSNATGVSGFMIGPPKTRILKRRLSCWVAGLCLAHRGLEAG